MIVMNAQYVSSGKNKQLGIVTPDNIQLRSTTKINPSNVTDLILIIYQYHAADVLLCICYPANWVVLNLTN